MIRQCPVRGVPLPAGLSLVPARWGQGCEMDGDTEDEYGGEHYWHCETQAVVFDPDEQLWLCGNHAEMLGTPHWVMWPEWMPFAGMA